jgi:hypothetical protein
MILVMVLDIRHLRRKSIVISGKKSVAFGEIFLLVSFSFAIAFVFGESVGLGSAQSGGDNVIRFEGGQTGQEALDGFGRALEGPGDASVDFPVSGGGLTNAGPVGANTAVTSSRSFGTLVNGKFVAGDPTTATHFLTKDGYVMEKASQSIIGKVGANGIIDTTKTVIPGSYSAGIEAPGTFGSLIDGTAFGTTNAGATLGGALLSGAIWGAAVGGIAYGVAKMMGLNDKSAAGVGLGLGLGTFAGASLYLWGANSAAANAAAVPWFAGPFASIAVGGLIAGGIIYATYTKEKKELVKFECYPWEPPTGGEQCEICNDDELPCSEYRCKSLGQACDIINPGTLEERCIWIGKGDTSAPKINPWEEALTEGLKYIPDQAVSPPNRGFKIVDEAGDDECLPAFLNFDFGVIADEPAQCRVDFFATNNYENMSDYFGGNNFFIEEHEQSLKVPTPFSTPSVENPVDLEIGSDGTFQLWVRCIDANGNGKDSAEVVFSFCVDDGPDLTQPQVVGASVQDGAPVRFGSDEVSGFELYTNEPAQCKWSRQDTEYSNMENEMECPSETYQVNADLNYACQTTLTGIVDSEENKFYFRCQDYSTDEGGPNTMETSYEFSLKGTEKLTMKAVGPTEDQTGSSDVVVVNLTAETAHGADEGVSVCYYSRTPGEFSVAMEGDTHLHFQQIDLTEGEYTYYYRCNDAANNVAEGNTTFNVIVDKAAPKVTRVYRDGNQMKVITDEDAACYYSLSNCNYNIDEAANALSYVDPRDRKIHYTGWDESKTYYVKCEDFRGRQPDPDKCQLIVKASEL